MARWCHPRSRLEYCHGARCPEPGQATRRSFNGKLLPGCRVRVRVRALRVSSWTRFEPEPPFLRRLDPRATSSTHLTPYQLQMEPPWSQPSRLCQPWYEVAWASATRAAQSSGWSWGLHWVPATAEAAKARNTIAARSITLVLCTGTQHRHVSFDIQVRLEIAGECIG